MIEGLMLTSWYILLHFYLQIEFAIGAADTTYGKMRADLGHPEPYNVPYVEIGKDVSGRGLTLPAYRSDLAA